MRQSQSKKNGLKTINKFLVLKNFLVRQSFWMETGSRAYGPGRRGRYEHAVVEHRRPVRHRW